MMTGLDDFLPVINGAITLPEVFRDAWAGKTVPWTLDGGGELSIYTPELLSKVMNLTEEELVDVAGIAAGTLHIDQDGRLKLPDVLLPMLQGSEVFFIGRMSFPKLMICTDVEAERRAETEVISEEAIREALLELEI